jgi:hypothetical protein
MSRVAFLALLLVGCGGDAFEAGSFPDSSLAGAQSSAGAQAIGSSAGLSGVAGADAGELGGAGGTREIPDAPGGAGGAVLGGADSGGAPPIGLPCNVKAWKASAFASSATELPALAIDGAPASRWSSGVAREPGQWFALELGAGVVLERLEIRAETPSDVPAELALELDGKAVSALATSPAPGVLQLAFEARSARSARLVLTRSALTWWSIAEVTAVCQ